MSGTTNEASSFDATVAQYETTDPVLGGAGGAANAPIVNLTNRTRYLYTQVVAIQAELPLLAPIAGPTFTGNVTMQGGSIELGPLNAALTPYIDFHSSGFANDYDVRLLSQGGSSGASGQGALSVYAAKGISVTGTVTTSATPNGFVVGSIPAGNAAAFLANLPAGYSSYIIQLGINGKILFFVDSSGNVGVTGGLSVTGAISVAGTLSLSGYANLAGAVYVQSGSLTVGGQSTTTPALDFRSFGSGSNSFDAQITVTGGTSGSNGGGALAVTAASVLFNQSTTTRGNLTSTGDGSNCFVANPATGYSKLLLNLAIGGVPAAAIDYTGTLTLAGKIILTEANAGIEIGSTTATDTPYIDLHSSGSANDFDVRIIAFNGTPNVVGQGALSIIANAGVSTTGTVTTTSSAMGFSVAPGGAAQGDVAAFYLNAPASYTYDVVACRVGGVLVFASDHAGNTGMSGNLTVGGNASASGNLNAGGGITAGGAIASGGGLVVEGSEVLVGAVGETPSLSFISAPNGAPNSYDTAVVSTGGSAGQNGQGIMSILAKALMLPAVPAVDNSLKAATTAFASGVLNLTGKAADGQSRGHQVLPSGLIVQWGFDGMNNSTTSSSPTGQSNTFNFDTPFPNECFGVLLCEAAANGWFGNPASPGGPAPTLYGVNAVNVTGFAASVVGFTALANGTVNLHTSTAASFFFIALGF